MKKLLIALLALSVAGTVFAADPALTFSGALKTGLKYTSSDAEGVVRQDAAGEDVEASDGAITLYSDDAEVLTRIELNGAYTDGDFGVKFRIRSDDLATLYTKWGYAWGNLFNNMVTFKVGNVDDASWSTKGDAEYDFADGKGLQIQVKPMAGLNAGVKLSASGTAQTTNEFISETALGLGYSTDMFDVNAGYKMDSDGDVYTYSNRYMDFVKANLSAADYALFEAAILAVNEVVAADEASGNAAAYFGFNYKGMKGLKAVVEAKFADLGSPMAWNEFCEEVAYDVSDMINVGVRSYQTMFSFKDAADEAIDMYYSVMPYASYKMNDKVTLAGEFTYYAGMVEEHAGWTLKPKATFQLAPKAKVVTFLAYNSDTPAKDVDAVNTTTVQLDFIWSF